MAFTNCKEVFDNMSSAFQADAAKNENIVFQYDISGPNGGTWNVVVKDGTCQVNEGKHASPSVTLAMSDETALGMFNKQINGMQAYMSGKLKVSGNIMLAQKMQALFKN